MADADLARLTRAGVRETMLMDYVKFARAKGLSPFRVTFVHVFKNILIPVVTVTGLEFGSTIAFSVVTESIFAWPGMGKAIYQGILDNDYNLALVGLLTLITFVGEAVREAFDPKKFTYYR